MIPALKLLIADDDRTSRKMLGAIAEEAGYDIMLATGGDEAWQHLTESDAPPLALLDWMMPGLDGIEICRKLQEMDPDTPPYIILVTSRDANDDIIQGLQAGASDYLAKPFDSGELRARLDVGKRVVRLRTELTEARDAFQFEATHDSLTGMLDRATILNELKNELARARSRNRPLGIAMCDIDHFKNVNDTYGHQAGDRVLCEFAERVKTSIRKVDSSGRCGGEEFLIVAPGTAKEAHNHLWQRIRTSISDSPFDTDAGQISITLSIGVAFVPPYVGREELLAAADRALYDAKDAGRNRVKIADRPEKDAA